MVKMLCSRVTCNVQSTFVLTCICLLQCKGFLYQRLSWRHVHVHCNFIRNYQHSFVDFKAGINCKMKASVTLSLPQLLNYLELQGRSIQSTCTTVLLLINRAGIIASQTQFLLRGMVGGRGIGGGLGRRVSLKAVQSILS